MINKLKKISSSFPNDTGIYKFLSASEILYIGKAKNLKKRIISYFSGKQTYKTQKLISYATKLEYVTTNNEVDALLLEQNLIKSEKPKNVSTIDVNNMINEGWTPFIIDCRTQRETEIAKLENVNLSVEHTQISAIIGKIPKNKDILVYCHHGSRSMYTISVLMNQGFNGKYLYNLAGGIDSWSLNVDPSIRRY